MSNKPYKGFEPKWLLTPAPADSYRSIFRWGDPNFFKYPKESLYTLMKETFKMTDDDFKEYSDDIGFDPVDLSDHPVQLAPEHIEALKKIVGERNVSTTDYDRLSVAYGFTAYDILRLRHKRVDSVPDVVLYPETTEQVEQIVAYSTEHHIPLYVYGGGSTYYADAAADLSIVNGGTSITLNSADSVLTINNYVCGGGNRSATVYGGTRIEFTRLGDNLNFTSYVIGSNNRNQNTYGEKELVFNGFTGSFNAKIAYFDTITISGSAVNWTKSQTLAEVSEWNFDLSGSGPALTWENGTNDFSGDTLNLTFGGAYTGGVVFSGSGATLTGWESVGAVNIGGSAAVRDGSVWRVAGAWELSRNADNQLILSKLA